MTVSKAFDESSAAGRFLASLALETFEDGWKNTKHFFFNVKRLGLSVTIHLPNKYKSFLKVKIFDVKFRFSAKKNKLYVQFLKSLNMCFYDNVILLLVKVMPNK